MKHIYVSLDLGSIDQIYAPAAAMPNMGGLSYREVALIASHIGRRVDVVSVDVVEYNPLKDDKDYKTAAW